MRIIRSLIAAAVFLPASLSAQAVAQQAGPAPLPAHGTSAITAADVQERIAFLASDALAGRNTPSPGLETAASYVAAELARFGLKPGGDQGTFIQRYPFAQSGLDRAAVAFRVADTSLAYGEDFFVVPGSPDSLGGKALYVGTARAEMSFPAVARGRIIVVAVPDTLGSETMQRWQGNLVAALQAGRAAEAAGVVAVLDPAFNPASIQMLSGMTAQQSAPLPLYGVSHTSLAPALTAAGIDLAQLRATEPASPVELPLDLVLRTASGRIPVAVPNVVGVLPGSDPVLRDEYVVFSAHIDHVGIGRPDAQGDSIFNGADDDASGTTAVLEVAQAFAAQPKAPARSLIFLLVSGEEKGLRGSAHFAAHPTVPIDKLVADINIDMIGRNHPDTVSAIGQEYTDLGATLQQVAGTHAAELKLVAAPDLWPEEDLFTRSDHYSFATRGVPAIFFTTGLHADYHKQSDEPETIDNDKLSRIARMVYLLGEAVANSHARPQWTEAGKAKLKLQ
jgi:hypothetical protein